MNVSLIEFESLEGLVIDKTWRIFDAIIFLLGLFIGSVFYWGMIYYEKYGGDPMKRSLQNKLVTIIMISIILDCYIFRTAVEWRIQIGTLNDEMAMVVIIVYNVSRMLFGMGICEILIYKVLAINKWSYICSLDEDFWSKFILRFNVGFSLITQFSRCMFGSMNNQTFGLLKGSYLDVFLEPHQLFWPIFVSIIVFISITGGIILVVQKIRYKNVVNPIILNPIYPNFNVVALNKPLLSTSFTFALLGFFSILYISTIIYKNNVVGIRTTICIFAYIIVPISVLSIKTTFRKFLFQEIKECVCR